MQRCTRRAAAPDSTLKVRRLEARIDGHSEGAGLRPYSGARHAILHRVRWPGRPVRDAAAGVRQEIARVNVKLPHDARVLSAHVARVRSADRHPGATGATHLGHVHPRVVPARSFLPRVLCL